MRILVPLVFAGPLVLTSVAAQIPTLAAAPAPLTTEQVVEAARAQRGLIVHLGCGDGTLTARLRGNEHSLVHGLDVDAANVRKARAALAAKGLYGPVSVEPFDGRNLPYADNLVNLLVVEDAADVSREELLRVLAPLGTAYVKKGEAWEKVVKPWPKDIDEWTHWMHGPDGNGVSKDARVGPPRYLQWVADPLHTRSHDYEQSIQALVTAKGRLISVEDQSPIGLLHEKIPDLWALVARDAFNGTVLWKRPLPGWGWRAWDPGRAGKVWWVDGGLGQTYQLVRFFNLSHGRLVADADRVFVTLDFKGPVCLVDATTGETRREYPGTEGTGAIVYDRGRLYLAGEATLCVDADSGRILWRGAPLTPTDKCVCLAVGEDAVYGIAAYDSRQKSTAIVALERETGKLRWQKEFVETGKRWLASPNLVAAPGHALYVNNMTCRALSAKDGSVAWEKPCKHPGPGLGYSDLFNVGGVVWFGGNENPIPSASRNGSPRLLKTGYDLATGRAVKTVDVANLISLGHHDRCYPSRATGRYLLYSKRGVECVDLSGENHSRDDWYRGTCALGLLPANGLLYGTPDPCACYPEAHFLGFRAASGVRDAAPRPVADADRLEKGPAYGTRLALEQPAGPGAGEDWPMHRHDPERSGSSGTVTPADVAPRWTATGLGGGLSQPVVAGGSVLVAGKDTDTVHCLRASDGKKVWSFIAGGPVDSAPTVLGDLVLFGCADGSVYCLRRSDGTLVWRLLAAPEQRRVVAFGRVESPWPVHGSVMPLGGLVYFLAGRNSFLDGGVYLYAVEPATGKVVYQRRWDGPRSDVTKDAAKDAAGAVAEPFSTHGVTSDLLVAAGERICLRKWTLKKNLETLPVEPTDDYVGADYYGGARCPRHLYASGGLLNPTWFGRDAWAYGDQWRPLMSKATTQSPAFGQLIVFDDATCYGMKVFTHKNDKHGLFYPEGEGCLVFADPADVALCDLSRLKNDQKPPVVRWLPQTHYQNGGKPTDPTTTDLVRTTPPLWMSWQKGVLIRAMVKTKDVIFAAGSPDQMPEDDPLRNLEFRRTGVLRGVSSKDGKTLLDSSLEACPVFDGMSTANGRLFVSLRNGSVVCLAGKR